MGVHSESNMMKLTLLTLAAAATLVLGAPGVGPPQAPQEDTPSDIVFKEGVPTAPLAAPTYYDYYEDQRTDKEINRVQRDLFEKDSVIEEEDSIFPSAPSGPAEAGVVQIAEERDSDQKNKGSGLFGQDRRNMNL